VTFQNDTILNNNMTM